jgi:hypothetical protein
MTHKGSIATSSHGPYCVVALDLHSIPDLSALAQDANLKSSGSENTVFDVFRLYLKPVVEYLSNIA